MSFKTENRRFRSRLSGATLGESVSDGVGLARSGKKEPGRDSSVSGSTCDGRMGSQSTVLSGVDLLSAGSTAALMAAQREFLSMVSHEFRTPLATMEGTHFLMRQRLAEHPDPQVRRFLEIQSGCLSVLREIVDQVLLIRRYEMDAPPAEYRWTRVAPLLRTIVDHINAAWSRARVVLTSRTDCEVPLDEHLFRAAVDNLISNALKYSSEDKPVDVLCELSGRKLKITVSDQGCGIPASDRPRVFSPFFRASNVGARPGTGLGLTIVRWAMERHGGSVAFESVEGSGSSFELSFPHAVPVGERPAA